ncbi:hypothetical protein, partial [Ralstonia pseudosolanacearum]|uniref:hypothetical protein n=1 Tax=Ralstonia pseudosolanacearum TaxID=1310165 RepID=UPI002005C29F
CMFPAKIENLRRNPVCLQRYRHVVARKRQHGLTTTLIYATTPGIRTACRILQLLCQRNQVGFSIFHNWRRCKI